MNILLIGGTGGLGTDLAKVLADGGRHEVFAPPHSAADLLYPDKLRAALDATRADVAVNAAAIADVDLCEKEPERAFQINGDGVRYLSTACRERNVLLVQVSTDYVFDGRKGRETPYTEADKTRPVQVYGKSKLAGERHALQIAGKAIVARTSWLFGHAGRKNFANKVLDAARDGGEVRAVADWYGSPTSTVDAARAIRALIEHGATGIFHVVNPGAQSRVEQAREILAAFGPHKATLVPIESATILNLPAARPGATPLANDKLASLGIHMLPRADAVREFVGAAR